MDDRRMTPRKKLPRNCKWAVDDVITFSQMGQDMVMEKHQASTDPKLMHWLIELNNLFNKIETTANFIGVEQEEK